jgi:hypothetical protein
MGLSWMMIMASSTTVVAIPCGPWQAKATNAGRGWGELRARTGNIQVVLGVQYTNDVRNPVAATAVGSVMAADGVSDPLAAGWTTLPTAQYKYWRPVWLVSLTAGTTIGTAAVAGMLETRLM